MQLQYDLVRIGPGILRKGLPFPDRCAKHPVSPLARTLHKAAPAQRLRETTIPRKLAFQNIFLRNAWWKPTRANNLDLPRKLPDKHGPPPRQ